jgi:diguanylate cyclase (GGDEF)-like protein/PAS domain S-box-containing protein
MATRSLKPAVPPAPEDLSSESAERFRDVAGAAGEYVWELDLAGRFIYVSSGIERAWGYSPAEVLGRTPVDFMPLQERDRVRKWVAENMGPDGGLRDFEHQVLTPSGELRWMRVSAVGVFDRAGTRIGQRGTGRDITDRKQAEQRLADAHSLLAQLVDAVPDPITVKDQQFRFVTVNDAYCRLLGRTRESLIGQDERSVVPPEHARRIQEQDRAALSGPQPVVCETEIVLDGRRRWLLVRRTRLARSDGSLAVLTVFTDLTERRTMEQALRASENRFRDFTSAASEFVWENDLDGRFSYVSDRVQAVWGYTDAELRGRTPLELAPADEAERVRDWLGRHLEPDGSFRDLEMRILTKSGEVRWLLINAVGLFDEQGRRVGQRGAARDITDRKQAEARITHLATRDALTDLPNRVLLNDRLQQALANARRQHAGLAVMFIDLDRFKNINDSLGHDVGDELLRCVAARLKECLRKGDTLARLGGDEFVAVLEGLHTSNDAQVVGEKILCALSEPFTIAGQVLATTASIGASVYPSDGDDPATLMRNADTAMYHAKGLGRNALQFFSQEMNLRAMERHRIETALRRAMDAQQFQLGYQPQLDVHSGRVVGAEVLLRWKHPQLGQVSPASFIPLAEEIGLIQPLGDWVLDTACAQLARWPDSTNLRVAVNLSVGQLRDSRAFLDRARAIIGSARIDPRRIEFEITETLLVSNVAEHSHVLRTLGELGCGIAVDDFGTGYSSLSYLKRLPIDTLKIDRSFVRDIVADEDDAAIVSAIVALARKLKLDVVAEGVETQEQLAVVRELGCDRYQGYVVSPAVAADEFAARFLGPQA